MFSFVFGFAFVISLMTFLLLLPAASQDLSDETRPLQGDEEGLETSIVPNAFFLDNSGPRLLTKVYPRTAK